MAGGCLKVNIVDMTSYLLFCGETYYSLGGWRDFRGSFDSIEEAAFNFFSSNDWDWMQVVDSESSSVVLTAGTIELGGCSLDKFLVAMSTNGEVLRIWSSEEFHNDKKTALEAAINLIQGVGKG